MKKRILSFLLMAALVLALLPLQTHALTASTREEIEYLPDGGYIVTTIEESANRASGTKSGNTARGSATIKRKVLGITISTDTYNLTLSCDSNGNLS